MKQLSEKEFNFIRNELNKELISRIKTNPKYSMRAFAKNLNMPVSTLNSLLNGKRRPSRETFNELCSQLRLSKKKIKDISEGYTYDLLKEDELKTISEWYYYPILELLCIKNFLFTANNISHALKISLAESKDALERLQRLKFIAQDESGWHDLTSGFISSITSEMSSAARRFQQKQLLQKSLEALDNVLVEKRSHTSATMAIHSDDLPKAKILIDKFRRDLGEMLAETKDPDQVYTLLINFFPNTNLTNGEEE
jgi:transcriptional regulator with XRE-family HTH domain